MKKITISVEAYARIQQYTAQVDVSVNEAVSDAVIEWMDGTGEIVLESLRKRRKEREARGKLTLVPKSSAA